MVEIVDIVDKEDTLADMVYLVDVGDRMLERAPMIKNNDICNHDDNKC